MFMVTSTGRMTNWPPMAVMKPRMSAMAAPVWTARESFSSSCAPKNWPAMTAQPAPMPMQKLMVRSQIAAVAWTPPSTSLVENCPTTKAFTSMYACWKKLARTMGHASWSSCCQMTPSVTSMAPDLLLVDMLPSPRSS